MLQARLGQFKHTDDEDKIDAYVEDISITPLAIPMICGPGAITNAIILMDDARHEVFTELNKLEAYKKFKLFIMNL